MVLFFYFDHVFACGPESLDYYILGILFCSSVPLIIHQRGRVEMPNKKRERCPLLLFLIPVPHFPFV